MFSFGSENGFEIKIQSEIQRKIKIMQLISIEKRWYTVEEISQTINISAKTISKDLACIKDIIPHDWEIKIKKGYGVKLSMPINASVKKVISAFFRESLTFQVLKELMEKSGTTVTAIAENLHIQPYVVTKVLKKVEKDMAQYGLKLKRKPLEIIGEEWKVVFMLTKLYSRAYLSSEWPFQYNQEIIFRFIEKIENSMDVVLYLGSRRILSYYIAILLIRKQQGYEIQWVNNFSKLNMDTPYFQKISTCLDRMGEDVGIHFSVPEKIILTIVYKCLDYIDKNPNKRREYDIQIFHERKVPVYNLIREFIEMLTNRLGYQFIKNEEFIYSLILHLRKRIYILRFYPYLKRPEITTIQYMKKKHLKTFLQVKNIYNEWIRKHEIAHFVPDHEIVKIVMYIEAARICNNITPKKTVLITNEGDGWKNYISAIIKDKFGDKIAFPTIISSNLARECELETEHDIDFIISTIPLRVSVHPVILIQPVVTERDLQNIEFYINK
ncbi:BglG family transcription antiterminator [Bacillus cereus]|uniref:BglG family transcription antiterminator n=1 Tax=Bacillus cereus TaxID=1396 RepID=UPI000BFA550E|nr:helix-turn-helix domain-containing protein [Bacillus cereus]PEX87259.1 capsule biosynthesis protein [Bacillus cereus]